MQRPPSLSGHTAADNDAAGAACEQVASTLARVWLSRYGACCAEEGEEMHQVVVARVLQAVDAAASPPPSAGSAPLPPQCKEGGTCTSDVELRLDLCGLWMPLSGWLAALRSVVAVLPLHRLSVRDAAFGDAALRCLCRQVATAAPAPHASAWPARGCSASSLRVLHLRGAGLSDAGPLASLLTACPHLSSLDLSENRLGTRDAGLALLCAAAQLHPSLSELCLQSNHISGAGGGAVMAALAELIVARSVAEPRADGGEGDDRGVALASSTPSAPAPAPQPLRRLDLSHNLLGLYYLASGCCCDPDIGAVTSFPLIVALHLNNTLAELDLRDNGLPDAVMEYVEAKLHTNRRTGAAAAAAATGHVALARVQHVLQSRLGSCLAHIRRGSGEVDGGGDDVTTRRWTADEVASLVHTLVRNIAADVTLR
ncbi:Leucine Rich repeat [Novymonas esmeraldas]|uniref:Leucine Rich repeat n=1 Tax=Novymonas esmeraldas TaxID=1808958 RepID=A0AAW0EIX4_9TRYP